MAPDSLFQAWLIGGWTLTQFVQLIREEYQCGG